MRLALEDVKKRVVRRAGEAYVSPYLLAPGELAREIDALVALHESWLGRERGDLPVDRPAELIGDYRLARCLVAVLGEWYAWTPVPWPGPAAAGEAAALAGRDITSPPRLRLALYDAVNAAHGGYLAADARDPALDAFAAALGVARPTLDALLALDREEHARLQRLTPDPPASAAVAARYNRRAVEALLARASAVEWIVSPEFAAARGTPLGTLLKRICFQARRMGIAYDVVFADPPLAREPAAPAARVAERPAAYAALPAPLTAPPAPAPLTAPPAPAPLTAPPAPALDDLGAALCITLFGAQEAFGGPAQYGERLARLCRVLLRENRPAAATPAAATPATPPPTAPAAGLTGEARVHLNAQPFRFVLDERLLALLDPAPAPGAAAAAPAPAALDFDSTLESRLFAEYAALERADATYGWHMEREPAPILCADTILIPDFALTRAGRRVYLEVAGYWSPAYRERKRRKLAALAGRVALIVAAPEGARAELHGLDAAFPFIWFTRGVGAAALLNVLQARYNDFAERRGRLRPADLLDEIERRGLLPWAECRAALHAHGRTEIATVAADLAAAAGAIQRPPPILLDGVGLASPAWLEAVAAAVARGLAGAGDAGLPLADLAPHLRDAAPGLDVQDDEAAAETLVRAAGYRLERAALFEPARVLPAAPGSSGLP